VEEDWPLDEWWDDEGEGEGGNSPPGSASRGPPHLGENYCSPQFHTQAPVENFPAQDRCAKIRKIFLGSSGAGKFLRPGHPIGMRARRLTGGEGEFILGEMGLEANDFSIHPNERRKMKYLKSIVTLIPVLGLLAACSAVGDKVDADADAADASDVPAEPDTGGEELATDEGMEDTLDAADEGMEDTLEAADGLSVYPLAVTAETSWDIGSDNNNNLYISWLSGRTIYFGRIVGHAVTEQQTAAANVYDYKYCIPRLSVRPDGQSMSIVYATTNQRSLKHAWRDSGGTWHDETIAGPFDAEIFYPAGAVGGDGTVHAVYSLGAPFRKIYYTYKRVGEGWVTPVEFDDIAEGARMVVDPNGGIHCTWMPYLSHIYYRYVALGETLDNSDTVTINSTSTMGNGGIAVTHSGTVHLSPHFSRQIWHTYKPMDGTFSDMTCASVEVIEGEYEIFNAIGAEESGKVFVSWAQMVDGVNSVQLSVLQDGNWMVQTVDPQASVGGRNAVNMPAIAMTDNAAYLLWRHDDNSLYLGEYPLH